MKFKERPDHELQRLDDDQLIEYICAARDAGEFLAARRGAMVLTWGLMSLITARMRMRVPAEYAEDVALEAFEKAARGAFRGESIGQFRAWLNRIIHGTATDWLRRSYSRPEFADPLGPHGDEPGLEPAVESESGAVELRLVTEEVLAELSDGHRLVIELHVFEGLPAQEVCDRIDGMKPDNVAKIASRFRKRMREALEGGT